MWTLQERGWKSIYRGRGPRDWWVDENDHVQSFVWTKLEGQIRRNQISCWTEMRWNQEIESGNIYVDLDTQVDLKLLGHLRLPPCQRGVEGGRVRAGGKTEGLVEAQSMPGLRMKRNPQFEREMEISSRMRCKIWWILFWVPTAAKPSSQGQRWFQLKHRPLTFFFFDWSGSLERKEEAMPGQCAWGTQQYSTMKFHKKSSPTTELCRQRYVTSVFNPASQMEDVNVSTGNRSSDW